jgi:endonuclease/exonuclease/phosphatase family metal-dependent hydrolase
MKFRVIVVGVTLFKLSSGLDCKDIVRVSQTQPPSYVSSKQKASRDVFESYEQSVTHINNEVPGVCDGSVRIATYNIHRHMGLHDSGSNIQAVRADLIKFTPTAIVFEEVVSDVEKPLRKQFDQMLESLGYKYRELFASGSSLGNMIASKIPLTFIARENLGSQRGVIAASLEVGSHKIAVLGTHLEVSSSVIRQQQARQIVNFLKKYIIGKFDRYILVGDMNSGWRSPEVQTFANSKTLWEAFSSVSAIPPKYTCWAGTAIDFVFVSPILSGELYGAYVYHTTSSDHLPVMIDVVGTSKDPVVIKSASWVWWPIILGGALLASIAIGTAFNLFRI